MKLFVLILIISVFSGQVRSQQTNSSSNYDFIPGNKIIFEDTQINEQIGEHPSRWKSISGNAENAVVDGKNVIRFVSHGTKIVPLLKKGTVLTPDVFTIEIDIYTPEDLGAGLIINLFDFSKFESLVEGTFIEDHIYISPQGITFGSYNSSFVENGSDITKKGWWRFSLAFNKRSLKIYADEQRMINVSNLETKPFGLTIGFEGDNYGGIIRNIRIAEGGKSLYDQIFTEGKIVTHGILFDPGKSVIKPQSMGVISEVVTLLNQNPELRLRIEGHTDSDGDAASNLKLSENRANAVRDMLIKNKIDASRLEIKGYGETVPIDTNDTPEGKANNRRVEFVKL